TIEEIIQENPEAANGLEIGTVLFIPKNIKKPQPIVETVVAEEGNQIVLVKAQETVYGLCKKYAITESEFYRLNPHVKDLGLQIGQEIQVPKLDRADAEPNKFKESKSDSWSNVGAEPKKKKNSYFLYQVKTGDRLENVAARYSISPAQLTKLNPEIDEELIPGRFIILPAVDESKTAIVTRKHKWISNEEIVEDEIRIALVLPFFLSINDSMEVGYANPSKAPVYRRSKVAIEFYNGFKQAMDTLAALGLNIKVTTIDSDNDLNKIKRQKQKIDLLNPHFIVGPLYAKNAEWLAKEYPDIPIISPLSKVTNNQGMMNLINCHTQLTGEWLGLAGIINENYLDYRIVFVNPDTKQNREGVELIKRNLESAGSPNLIELWLSDGYPNIDFYKSHINDSAHKTVWVITSEDQAFLNDFMTKMYSLKTKNMKMLTTSKVLEAKTVQKLYLSTLNIKTTTQDFVDYTDEETNLFIKKYRENCFTEPTEYSFKGYDSGIYFTLLAARFGGIPISRSWPSFKGIGTGYNFIEANRNGPTNKYINVLEIVDFTLQRASN
ncbi:MAG: LysM peptidoglycan-binding domain-containing protein, partial [Schleiferiaceae bacterium]|nr:LysM peptidoglycan-binding domain-containing protein [Schleiferiaceae bacterium]